MNHLLEIKLVALAVIAVLWIIGGGKNAWARDWIIPFIVGAMIFISHPFGNFLKDFLFSFLTAGACNIIRMGYGGFDPEHDDTPSLIGGILKDRGGWWIRAVWGLVVGIVCFVPAFYFKVGAATGFKCGAYALQLATVCFIVTRFRWPSFWTDLAIGISFGSIIFIITLP